MLCHPYDNFLDPVGHWECCPFIMCNKVASLDIEEVVSYLMISSREMWDVDVYGPYLVGIVSYCLSVQGNFILAKDISRYIQINGGYGTVYNVVVCYISFLVLGGGSPNDELYLKC